MALQAAASQLISFFSPRNEENRKVRPKRNARKCVSDTTPSRSSNNPVLQKRPSKGNKVNITKKTKDILDSVLEDSTYVPETQESSVGLPSPLNDTTIPESQYSQPDSSLEMSESANESSLLIENVSINDPPSLFSGGPIETIVNQREISLTQVTKPLVLFRGPKNPLSSFYHQKLLWKRFTFISAEQAYQYEKLIFHNIPQFLRNRLLKCRSSHDVKRVANKLVPEPCEAWDKIKFDLMTQITTAKYKQCKRFEEALIQSKDAQLIHNVETDSEWGCGMDMKGLNMMGNILMEVRDNAQAYHKEFPPLPSISLAPQQPQVKTDSSTNKLQAIVIGNSNARGLATQMSARGVDCTGYVYPGQTAAQIKNRIPFLDNATSPTAVVCHIGDVEIRDRTRSLSSIVSDYSRLIHDIYSNFPNSKILVSGLPSTKSRRQSPLRSKIEELNNELSSICSSSTNCIFVSNSEAKLQDHIHMTARSKDLLAHTIAGLVKQCL